MNEEPMISSAHCGGEFEEICSAFYRRRLWPGAAAIGSKKTFGQPLRRITGNHPHFSSTKQRRRSRGAAVDPNNQGPTSVLMRIGEDISNYDNIARRPARVEAQNGALQRRNRGHGRRYRKSQDETEYARLI